MKRRKQEKAKESKSKGCLYLIEADSVVLCNVCGSTIQSLCNICCDEPHTKVFHKAASCLCFNLIGNAI